MIVKSIAIMLALVVGAVLFMHLKISLNRDMYALITGEEKIYNILQVQLSRLNRVKTHLSHSYSKPPLLSLPF